MKKPGFLLLLLPLQYACTPEIVADVSSAISGTYQLVDFVAPGKADDNPSGELTVKRLDNQHISLTVKGLSKTTKITYSYSTIVVSSTGRDEYTLRVKEKNIGEAGSDGISRYITLTPATGVRIKAVEF